MSKLYQREEQGEIYEHHSSRGVLKEVEDEAYDHLKSREYRLFDDAEGEEEKKERKCKNRKKRRRRKRRPTKYQDLGSPDTGKKK
jgi:hypothetical protein